MHRPRILISRLSPQNTIVDILNNIPTGVYQRKGQLVRIISVKESNEADKKNKKHPDTLIIRGYTVSILTLQLMRYIDFYKLKDKKGNVTEEEAVIGSDIVTMLIELGSYNSIKVLNGISETPFMRDNGSICNTVGYDNQSGVFYNPSCDFGNIPENPTIDHVKKSLSNIEYVFSDFPFKEEYHKVVPVALMLSIMLRELIGNVPLFVFEASTPGSGKTLLVDACSMILFGRVTPKNSWPTGRESNQELEKILSAIALDASQFVNFDNADKDTQIKGAAIDKVLTCNGSVKMRVLGKSLVPELQWRTVLALTGNNAVSNIRGDTTRRVCPCRIEPDCENPEDRSDDIKEKDLLGYVLKNRASLVCDLLTIARYWHNSGRPTCNGKRVGSFEDWCDVIGGILLLCTGVDIVDCVNSMREKEDDDYNTIVRILELLSDNFVNGFLSSDIVNECEKNSLYSSMFSVAIPGRDNINSRTIGKFFNRINGRIYRGYKLVKTGLEHRSIKWNVINKNKKEY